MQSAFRSWRSGAIRPMEATDSPGEVSRIDRPIGVRSAATPVKLAGQRAGRHAPTGGMLAAAAWRRSYGLLANGEAIASGANTASALWSTRTRAASWIATRRRRLRGTAGHQVSAVYTQVFGRTDVSSGQPQGGPPGAWGCAVRVRRRRSTRRRSRELRAPAVSPDQSRSAPAGQTTVTGMPWLRAAFTTSAVPP